MYRYCIIRQNGTGEEVGRIEWGYGAQTTREGTLVPPDTIHYREYREPDRPLRLSGPRGAVRVERLYVDGKTWSRGGGRFSYWHIANLDGSLGPLESQLYLWGLLDAPVKERPSFSDQYGAVERLKDTELDGIRVEHYLAQMEYLEGGSMTLEVWVGKEDRLIRKINKKGNGRAGPDTYSWNRTYTFSRFNEPVEIPVP